MKYDLIVIGFGKGGKTLDSKVASTNRKVTLFEKASLMYGGTCINVGCIPSKSLVINAKQAVKLPNDEKLPFILKQFKRNHS